MSPYIRRKLVCVHQDLRDLDVRTRVVVARVVMAAGRRKPFRYDRIDPLGEFRDLLAGKDTVVNAEFIQKAAALSGSFLA